MNPLNILRLPKICCGLRWGRIRLGWGSKFMERFGNSALQFSSSRQSVAKTDLPTIASATVEADTCRKYVVPQLQAAGWENVAEIIGKFGGADHFSLSDSALPITEYDFWAEKSN
jgi:hypothetical protein